VDAIDPLTAGKQPNEAALLELGGLVWAAINLEDAVFAVCRSVKPRGGPYDETPIGTRINEARRDLEARSDATLRLDADAWLAKAAEALQARNAVVHATPVTVVSLSANIDPVVTDPFLAHYPRDRSRAPIHTQLTAASLRTIRRQIERARDGWDAIALRLL